MNAPLSLSFSEHFATARAVAPSFIPAFRPDPKQLCLIDAPAPAAIERQAQRADRAEGRNLSMTMRHLGTLI